MNENNSETRPSGDSRSAPAPAVEPNTLPKFCAYFGAGEMRCGTVSAQPDGSHRLCFDTNVYGFETIGLKRQLLFFATQAERDVLIDDLLRHSLLRAA